MNHKTSNRLTLTAILCVVVLTFGIHTDQSHAQDDLAEPTNVDGLRVSLVLSSGERVSSRLLSFSRNEVALSSGPLSLDGLLRIDATHSNPSAASSALVELVNGDRLFVQNPRVRDDRLLFRLSLNAPQRDSSLELEYVRGIHFRHSIADPSAPTAAFMQRLESVKTESDRLYLANGDVMDGVIESIDNGEVTLARSESDEVVSVPVNRLTDVVLDPSLSGEIDESAAQFVLVTRQGGCVTCRDASWQVDGEWKATSVTGNEWRWPTSSIQSVRIINSQLLDLSRMTPLNVLTEGFFSKPPAPVADRNTLKSPMRIGKQYYARGWGCMSRTQLDFKVSAEDVAFYAEVGLDPSLATVGHVVFEVLVDGESVRQVSIGGEDTEAAIPIRVPLQSARVLSLRVDYGQRADIGDYANWGDALLIRSGEKRSAP